MSILSPHPSITSNILLMAAITFYLGNHAELDVIYGLGHCSMESEMCQITANILLSIK